MKRLVIIAMFSLVCTMAIAQKTVVNKAAAHHKELVDVVSEETGKVILKSVEKSEVGKTLFLSGFVGTYSIRSKKAKFSKQANKREVFEIK